MIDKLKKFAAAIIWQWLSTDTSEPPTSAQPAPTLRSPRGKALPKDFNTYPKTYQRAWIDSVDGPFPLLKVERKKPQTAAEIEAAYAQHIRATQGRELGVDDVGALAALTFDAWAPPDTKSDEYREKRARLIRDMYAGNYMAGGSPDSEALEANPDLAAIWADKNRLEHFRGQIAWRNHQRKLRRGY